jgi:hypothetical protein
MTTPVPMPAGWVLGAEFIGHNVHRLVDLPPDAQARYFDAVRYDLLYRYGAAAADSFDEAKALRQSAERVPESQRTATAR